jgi:CubicO group peptidase (beta-lactamase class C family)
LLVFTNSVYAHSDAVEVIENNLKQHIRVKGEPDLSISIVKRMKQINLPGLSVAVIHNGKIDWAKGYGISNGKAKVDTNTLFQAGSISKPIAALAALKLVEEGMLLLDVNVNQYLKGWKVEGDLLTKENPVTLRHLLTHTAGLYVLVYSLML